jgi:hypothetical protein
VYVYVCACVRARRYEDDNEQEYLDLRGNKWREVEWDETSNRRVEQPGAVGAVRRRLQAASRGAWSARSLSAAERAEPEAAAAANGGDGAAAAAPAGAPSGSTDDAAGGSGDAGGAGGSVGGGGVSADEWRSKGARLETTSTVNGIRSQLPITEKVASAFAPPPGWHSHRSANARTRLDARWVREATASDGQPTAVTGRAELEELLEEEGRQVGRPWLGQLVDGEWEIRPHAVSDALEWVVGQLVGEGLVRAISAEECGKGAGVLLTPANLYVRGEPFPRRGKDKDEEEEVEEEEEDLSAFELERKRNIARNQDILRQLGLA